MLLSESANYLVEDFEENVARKRLNELEGTFDVQGDEANFFDTGFPFAKIEHGRLMLYRPVSIERLDGENVKKLSIPYEWIDVTEYDEVSWTKTCNFVDEFRKGVDNFEIELQMNKAELEKRLKAINKYSKTQSAKEEHISKNKKREIKFTLLFYQFPSKVLYLELLRSILCSQYFQ